MFKAGLASPSNPEQIVIALEPEAASVYCREREMRGFLTENGNNDALVADILAHTAKHYVVIDIGGITRNICLVILPSLYLSVCPSASLSNSLLIFVRFSMFLFGSTLPCIFVSDY